MHILVRARYEPSQAESTQFANLCKTRNLTAPYSSEIDIFLFQKKKNNNNNKLISFFFFFFFFDNKMSIFEGYGAFNIVKALIHSFELIPDMAMFGR